MTYIQINDMSLRCFVANYISITFNQIIGNLEIFFVSYLQEHTFYIFYYGNSFMIF